jgi:hypothetical protein
MNDRVWDELHKLNQSLIEMGYDNDKFTIEVTGGDRYRDAAGRIRSLTNDSVITRPGAVSESPHRVDRKCSAVDVTVRGVARADFERAIQGTDFVQQIPPERYPQNPHWHLRLRDTTCNRLLGC